MNQPPHEPVADTDALLTPQEYAEAANIRQHSAWLEAELKRIETIANQITMQLKDANTHIAEQAKRHQSTALELHEAKAKLTSAEAKVKALEDAVSAVINPISYCDRTGQNPHEPDWLRNKLQQALLLEPGVKQ